MSARRRSRLYRLLLKAFPADFRRDFGPDMEQLFADRLAEPRDGRGARARLWIAAAADVAAHAGREWAAVARRGFQSWMTEMTTMDGWMQDLRFGIRALLRRPGFTSTAVGTLALGIGATVSIYSVIDGVLLTPLPYPDSERLVKLWSVDTDSGQRESTVDHPDIRMWQADVPGLVVAGYSGTRPTLTGVGSPEVVTGARVTDGVVTLLGYEPHLGRDLVAADDDPDGPLIVVVSHDFWTSRLGRDPDVLGRTIDLSGSSFEVVGVAPLGFDFPAGSELWVPRYHDQESCGHGCRTLNVVGRITPSSSLEQVQAGLSDLDERLASEYPDSHRDVRHVLEPLLESEVAEVRASLLVLFGAVGMVLLIACANVANLMLVRGNRRRTEVALRRSLGASRRRVVRQLMTESLIVASVAGVVGLALATWGTTALVAMAPDTLPRLDQVGLSRPVLLFTATLVVVVTGLFGSLPALQISGEALRDGLSSSSGKGSAGGGRSGLSRSVLVAGEVALSLALLLGAGLLFRTLVEIRRVDLGFEAEAAERFRISVPDSRYDSLGVVRFLDELEARIGTVPAVVAVGSGFGVPLASGSIGTSVQLLDRPAVDPADRPGVAIRPASPGFLDATGTPLLAGRWLDASDRYGAEGVAVINRAAALRFYPDVDPIGRRLQVDVSWGFAETPPLTIVGVIGDVRTESATDEPAPAVYLSNAQFAANSLYVWMRLRPGAETAIPEVRRILEDMDPEMAMSTVERVDAVVAAEQDAPRFFLTLLAVFSALALGLAVVGLYGVVAYSVSQRTREIGIRIALGAESNRVVRMVLRQNLRPVGVGVLVGLALSLVGARALGSLLYGVRPNDPLTVAATTLFLLAVALSATLLPAYRASRVRPATALRTE
jgi:putative ABC transport system permease protein